MRSYKLQVPSSQSCATLFDFELGTWNLELSGLLAPLSHRATALNPAFARRPEGFTHLLLHRV